MSAKFLEVWRSDPPLQIQLMDTRAARDIRVTFSFERDGWVISALKSETLEEDEEEEWVEKAFIPSWEENEP